jgi:replicative DNA helicase
MFINPDRDKNEDEQAKEIGEKVQLIVAKNRSGPVASIDMTFLSHLTKFVPYAGDRG